MKSKQKATEDLNSAAFSYENIGIFTELLEIQLKTMSTFQLHYLH